MKKLLAALIVSAAIVVSALAAPASATVFDAHGYWQGVSAGDGCGAMTSVGDAGKAGFIVKGSTLSLVLVNSDWSLNVGAEVPVSITIDGGETFSGTAVAIDASTVEISDVRMSVLKGFIDGAQAVINVNNDDIVWRLNLDGFTAAMADALRLYKANLSE